MEFPEVLKILQFNSRGFSFSFYIPSIQLILSISFLSVNTHFYCSRNNYLQITVFHVDKVIFYSTVFWLPMYLLMWNLQTNDLTSTEKLSKYNTYWLIVKDCKLIWNVYCIAIYEHIILIRYGTMQNKHILTALWVDNTVSTPSPLLISNYRFIYI